MRLTEEVTGFDDIECEVGASVTRSGTNFVVTEPDLQANHVTRSGRPRAQPAASSPAAQRCVGSAELYRSQTA